MASGAAAAAASAAAAAAAAAMGASAAVQNPPVVVSGSWDTTVRLWPLLPTGLGLSPLRTLGEHDDKVTSVALLPGETRVAVSGSANGEIAIWDARRAASSPAMLLTPHARGGGATTGVGLCQDASGVRLFSCASGGGVATTELRAARPVLLRASGPAQACLRTFEGGALTAGEDGLVNVWGAQALVTQRRMANGGGADGGGAIRAMHLWEDDKEVKLVTGHANGSVVWWAVPSRGVAPGA